MNFLKSFLLIAVAIAVSTTSSSANEFKRINKKSEFLQAVQGKKITADWGWVVFDADGNMSGKSFEKGAISGRWNWKGKFYCRTFTVGEEKRRHDCLTVHLSGTNIVFIRDRGRGDQIPAKIK